MIFYRFIFGFNYLNYDYFLFTFNFPYFYFMHLQKFVKLLMSLWNLILTFENLFLSNLKAKDLYKYSICHLVITFFAIEPCYF